MPVLNRVGIGTAGGSKAAVPDNSARRPVGYFPLLRLTTKSIVFRPSTNPLLSVNACQASDGCGGYGGIFVPVLVPLTLTSIPSLSTAHLPAILTVLRSKPVRSKVVRYT